MRLFIAVDLTAQVIQKIGEVTAYLQTQTPPQSIKWVSIDNLHLTLKFLGEVKEDKLEMIKSLAIKAVHEFDSFRFVVEGLGMYPNPKKPRVIWLGILNEKPLADLHARLDRALTKAEIEKENRPFSPHLTIGRVHRNTKLEEIQQIGEILSQFKVNRLGEVSVEKIILYQSVLKPQGPIYTPLLDIPLNKV